MTTTTNSRTRSRRGRAATLAAAATALAAVLLPLGPYGTAAAAEPPTAVQPAPGYRVSSTINLGTRVKDVAVDPVTGQLFALDGVPENDGDISDDAILSTIRVGGDGMRVVKTIPTIGLLNTLTVYPDISILYLDFVSPPYRPGFFAGGTFDETTGRFTYLDASDNACGFIGAVAYDPHIHFVITQFSDCGVTSIGGSGVGAPSTDTTSAIAASTTGRIYGLDPTHGQLTVYLHPDRDSVSRTVTVPKGPAHGALALDEPRHLVIAATGNHITALDDRTGSTVCTGTVSGTITDIAVDPATDTLYISATDGLTILDTRTGAVATRITTYGPTGPITVDTTRHIAFVAAGTRVIAVTSNATLRE